MNLPIVRFPHLLFRARSVLVSEANENIAARNHNLFDK